MKILILLISPIFFFQLQRENKIIQTEGLEIKALSDLKTDAFKILQTKCNVCHRVKNPGKVFTLNNMSSLAPKIYKQVFIKKRMPKNGAKLTEAEKQTLLNWLETIKY